MTQCAERINADEYDSYVSAAIVEATKRVIDASRKTSRSLVTIAEVHGVIPMIIEAERRRYISLGSDDSKELHDKAVHAAMHRLQMFSVIGDIIRILNDAGVPHLFVKGLIWEDLFYPAGITRMQSDIDLLVPPELMIEMSDLILHHPKNLSKQGLIAQSSHARTISFNGVTIDVHGALIEGRYDQIFDWESLYLRRQTVSAEWGNVDTLSTQDVFLLIVAHGSKHHWCKLKWVMDLVWLLDTLKKEELTTLGESVAGSGYQKRAQIAVGLAAPFLGENKRVILREIFNVSKNSHSIISSYNDDMFLERTGLREKVKNIMRVVRCSDSIYSGLRYVSSALVGYK